MMETLQIFLHRPDHGFFASGMGDENSVGIRLTKLHFHILHIFQNHLVLIAPVLLPGFHFSVRHFNSGLQLQFSAEKRHNGGASSAHCQIIQTLYHKAGPDSAPLLLNLRYDLLRGKPLCGKLCRPENLQSDSGGKILGIDDVHPCIVQLFLYHAHHIAGRGHGL